MFKKIIYSALTCFLFSLYFTQVAAINCDIHVELTQTLHNQGFHRNIHYEIIFYSKEESLSALYSDCIIGLDQNLPSGVFVNPDELKDLKRQNRINAIPKNRVNVELPAEESSAIDVFIISVVREDKASLWLPVHARYHAAMSGGGTFRNRIEQPKMFIRCPDNRLNECDRVLQPAVSFLCHGSKGNCGWKELRYTPMPHDLVWDIPIGNTDHYYLVATGTTLVIIGGSLYLLKTIHNYKIALKKNN